MPSCEAASVLPDPTGTASPMTALPDGVRGAAVFNVFEIGRSDFKRGQTPALNRVIAYSLQGAWSGPKPASENFPFKMTQRFFARLKNPRHQSGYQLLLRESIYLTPEPTAAAASGATLPPVSCISEPYFKSFLDHLVKVARQLAHHGQGNLRAHATAAFRALTNEPVQTLGVVRLYHAARLAAGGEGTDTQDPAILGQMGEFLEVCRLRKELGPTAIIEWLNVDFEMGKPFDILVRYPIVDPNGAPGYEEVEVDVKVAGIKAHFDPPRPNSKKPNATRELKIELRIPDDTLRLWRAPPVEGARRRVLRVVVPAMSARA